MRDLRFCFDNEKCRMDDVYNKLYEENVYELDGILQIFDNENELNAIYKYLIKYDRLSDEVRAVMNEKIKDIEEKLLERVDTAISDGYKIISLADPLSSIEFLGKKGAKVYIDTILLDLIYKIKYLCEKNTCILHLCPRLSALLKSDENTKFKEVKLNGSYNSLVEALLSNHKESITAFRCIHFCGEIDKIQAIRLD
nr:hypothetical protein [uncultured Lachnoanaerobaculum sp.]